MTKTEPSLLAQADHYIDMATSAIVPPVHASTTYARDEHYALIGDYSYSRSQNPTYDHVESLLTRLEGGADAKLFASGLAAVAAVFETVDTGAHIVAPRIMYHGAQDWLRRIAKKRGVELSLFDATDPGAAARAIQPGKTDIVWVESLTNPTWDVVDIAATAAAAHEAGAILGVDCTVSPPVTTKALALGADIVFHSATKYLNGHSDVTAGVLVTRQEDARWDEIKLVRYHSGGVLGPFEAWLLLRGMRTLALRFERASENAMRIATHLAQHPRLLAVLYPGLASHPGHQIAKRQMTNGFGGMLSVRVRGDAEDAKAVANRMKLFVRATSLGGVESLVEHRATIEGPNSVVPPDLLRLSVGIEDADELVEDLEQALEPTG